ncbi:angiopoietin-related protein 1-like [Drosophila nasuta]|uniref:angiopoietin-related protein 1-like n=1 Tax=Drosophila nasuta TaxID=42062 RepID=UPI00295E9CC1|nr:angiopoietin-related protein 1-like [Drosophila nasuta]
MINGNLSSYREGFSFVKSNFFLGLEKLYRLTRSQRYELYVHLVLSDDRNEYARYNNFKIDKNKYRNNRYEVTLGYCNGTSNLLDIPSIYYSEEPYMIKNIKLIFDHGVRWWFYKIYPRNTNLRVRYQIPTCDPTIKLANMLIRPLD